MIIEDPLEMGSQVRSIIETNPLALLLTQQKNDLQNTRQSFESVKSDTLDLRRRLQNSMIEENVYRQRVRKNEIKVRHLEKTVENSTNDFKCDFLNRESMAKFFEGIGLKFISLNIHNVGRDAYLSYIRPTRMISTLPTQPMIVNMYYELKNGTLRFRKPIITSVFTSSKNMHPHISGDSVCMGNYFDVFDSEDFSVHLEGYQDQVILLENLLATFNPDSPYARIDQIIMGIVKGLSYNPYEFAVDQGSTYYTFLNPKLLTGGQNYFYAHDLMTEDLFREYYAMLGNMPIKDTVQDIIDSLPNDYRDSDSESENFEHFQSYRNSLNKMFDIKLCDVESYANYEEDEDYYTLPEDQFEDMIGEWIQTLEPLLENEGYFEFNHLPDLEEMFPKPIIQETLTDASLAQEAVNSLPF